MKKLQQGIEQGFAGFGSGVYRFRWWVLVLCLLCCAWLGSYLKQITIDNSNDSYLHKDNPATIIYDKFRRQFGQDEVLLVAVKPPDVFDLTFLAKLREFHQALEQEVPHIEEVTSLINARQMRAVDDVLHVGELLEEWPQANALAALKQQVMNNPLYQNHYISRDGRLTAVVLRPEIESGSQSLSTEAVLDAFAEGDAFDSENTDDQPDVASGVVTQVKSTFLSPEKKEEIVVALDRVVERFESEDFQVDIAGGPFFTVRISQMLRKDVTAYMSVCTAIVVLLLLVMFRRLAGVMLPMVVVVVSLISTFGFMGMTGIPFSVTLQLVPVFLLCVCVCNCVHLLVSMYQQLGGGVDKRTAIAEGFRHSGLAIFMANLTTAAGMGSFVAADLLPVSYLGLVSSLGVILVFLLSITLLPALFAILPINPPRHFLLNTPQERGGLIKRAILWMGEIPLQRPWLVIFVSALIVLWAIAGMTQLRFSHQPISWFPVDHEVRVASELIDQQMGGSRSIEVVIDTGRENGLYDPLILNRIDESIAFAQTIEEGPLKVGKQLSFLNILKETHQALNANDPAFYRIPEGQDLVAQEMLLFENSGSDDLEPLVDSAFSQARISLRIPRSDRVFYAPFLQRLESGINDIFDGAATVYVTGVAPLLGQIFYAMVHSLATSYLIAFGVIVPLMILLIGSFRMGLMSMVPNFFPIVVVLGMMGWAGIPLDTSTILIGSILIGLAVDDTIHIMHHFRRYHDQFANVQQAVRATLSTTGIALLFTTLVLGIGFLAIGSNATMLNTIRLGYITALGIFIAFIADILISPALMMVMYQKRSSSKPSSSTSS